MSLQGMFIHECDIYHLQKETKPGKYGQPGEEVYSYKDIPDKAEQSCYFVATAAPDTIQSSPNQLNTEQIKVLFIPGTDVRHNDKVVKKNTNVTYYIRNPFPVVHPLTEEVNHIKAIAERKTEPWLTK
ncbi:DUF3599 family protein [Bacillus thuringiensis]|uniref:DUF3599 family protein n=1 Tax=Bacillus thuringiensis TaxID=1428 RepID=UPI0035DCCD41